MDRQRLAVLSFAICVVSSGVFCFILEREWLSLLSTAVKIPMYMVLGTSSCFAISFSVIDTVNTGCCTPDEADGGEQLCPPPRRSTPFWWGLWQWEQCSGLCSATWTWRMTTGSLCASARIRLRVFCAASRVYVAQALLQMFSLSVGIVAGAALAVWNQILGEREMNAEVAYAAIAHGDDDI